MSTYVHFINVGQGNMPLLRLANGETLLSSKNLDLADNANAQSIVIKVVHRRVQSEENLASVMLTGDTDAATWKNIREHYRDSDLACSILLASPTTGRSPSSTILRTSGTTTLTSGRCRPL